MGKVLRFPRRPHRRVSVYLCASGYQPVISNGHGGKVIAELRVRETEREALLVARRWGRFCGLPLDPFTEYQLATDGGPEAA